ncbi:DUF5776 domain-containing protein [Lentilactobacillus sp. Marseille-Q4993]|uniref:DUF5776 domain-containing protein n=1 Tax=Lentilactobacillus sp. Marseille-Q4993 TaxID=3039492 RepID=UPI0024BC1CBF|nr:DUF5776 domain-containing protein [Lentilactobacillus sp. Marseille-Q4993]
MSLRRSFYYLATTAGAALLGLGLSGESVMADRVDQTIDVDSTQTIRPAEHVSSGGLVALKDASTPNADLVSALHPRMFTQVVDGGKQISNGQAGPGGYFSDVAPTAHKVGAKVEIRLADYLSGWPYKFTGMDDWLSMVDKTMQATKKSQYKDDIYGYEILNEPDGSYESFNESGGRNGHGSWGSFYDLWDKTVQHIKQVDPDAKIVGPSTYKWDSAWMKNFLEHCKNADVKVNGKKISVMPDYISWHIGKAGKDVESNSEQLTKIEKELGISTDIKLNINEYGERQELGVPGLMVHYMQSFENIPNLDTANMSYWFNYGRLNNLLTDQQKPNGGYWLYKWYGDMTGNMVKTSTDSNPSADLASVANTDNNGNTNVLFGGKSGDTTINVSGLKADKYTNNTAKVTVSKTPWYGVDTAVDSPKVVEQGTVPVKDGKISVPVNDIDATSGYQLQVTPSDSKNEKTNLTVTQATDKDPIRVEAENSQFVGKEVFKSQGSYASADYYANHINKVGDGVTTKIYAPKSGEYKLEIGYGGGQASVAEMTLNGKKLQDASFEKSNNGIAATTAPVGNRKVLQYGTVSLKKGENTLSTIYKSGSLQLDYFNFTPVDQSTSSSTNSNNSSSSSSSSTSSISSSVTSSTSSSSSASSSSSSSSSNSAKKITNKMTKAIYAKRGIYEYKSTSFKKSNRVARVAKNKVLKVKALVTENGVARYQLTNGKYVTANSKYVRNANYRAKHSVIYVKSAKGINEYNKVSLTNKIKHLKKGTKLHVKKIVLNKYTSRFELTNGNFVTGNSKLISINR